MTREEKNQVIDELTNVLGANNVVYLADTSGMTVENTNKLRRICFNKNIQLRVVKNTLLKKAMEKTEKDFSGLFSSLHGTTAIMIAEASNAPAKLIKEFRKGGDKPGFKAAFVDSDIYLGESNFETLVNIKSREELIGDIIALLQSPAKNVISALQSNAGQKVAGLVKALEERAQ
ncbi:MAG: 50S ribosomal protein L10 [Candidatus Competibacteraceae bacterium]|nr:50S ribosomal protein L10 [Candidatus Competibacteraceae bacterium]